MAKTTRRGQRHQQLAAEAWASMMELFLARRHVFLDVAQQLLLTPGELHALMSLDELERRPMRWLADEWQCDASNVTWMVDRLEARGWVERHPSLTDRRVRTIGLTPAGVAMRATVRHRLFEPPLAITGLSTGELTELCRLLAMIDRSDPVSDGDDSGERV